MDFRTQAIEFLKAHDERTPLVGVDPVAFVGHQNTLVDVNSLHTHLEALTRAFLVYVVVRNPMDGLNTSFELHRTLGNPRR